MEPARGRRQFNADGRRWTAERISVRGRAMLPGTDLGAPRIPGLQFRAEDGEIRFLGLEYPALPTERSFAELSDDELRALLNRAQCQ